MGWTKGYLFGGGADEVTVNNRNVGGTKDGIRIRRETEWLDFEIDQIKFKAKKEAVLSSMFIETVLAEGTLDNLREAWTIATSALTSSSSLDLEEPSGTQEVPVNIEGPTFAAGLGGGGTKRVYNFPRCVALANGEVNINRGIETNVPLNLEVLADDTASPVAFGQIWDI